MRISYLNMNEVEGTSRERAKLIAKRAIEIRMRKAQVEDSKGRDWTEEESTVGIRAW